MCSHVPPLKEKDSFLSCMEVRSIWRSVQGHQPRSLNGLCMKTG